jgi:hypothetical protein
MPAKSRGGAESGGEVYLLTPFLSEAASRFPKLRTFVILPSRSCQARLSRLRTVTPARCSSLRAQSQAAVVKRKVSVTNNIQPAFTSLA